jgi:SET domain-containing protein
MEFGKKASKIILENKEWTDNVVSTELCSDNISMYVECDENCKGGEGCVNKKIQKYEWEKVKRKITKGKGYGLIASEDIEEDDFIVEYIGKVVCKNRENNYAMQHKGMELYIDPSKMVNAPGKYMNHSCIPNCRNEM